MAEFGFSMAGGRALTWSVQIREDFLPYMLSHSATAALLEEAVTGMAYRLYFRFYMGTWRSLDSGSLAACTASASQPKSRGNPTLTRCA